MTDSLPVWNQSVSLIDQAKERSVASAKFEIRMRQLRNDPSHYRSPSQRTSDFNKYMSKLMEENKSLVASIRSRLIYTDPDISRLRLNAMVFKELLETLRNHASPKLDIVPSRDIFRPILTMSLKSNKYKEYFHSGTFRNGKWTCCQARIESVRGCDFKLINPDACPYMPVPENHEGCCQTVGDVLTHTLVMALEEKEARLDEEINRLDRLDEDDLEDIRRKRLESMKENVKRTRELQHVGHGIYSEIATEKEFFEAAKNSKHLVCHFYRPSTWRCQIVDKHCEILARKYIECKFVKLNIEKSPYLAEKLRIVMLPTIMLINNGKTDHSIIGFDEMGPGDDFDTEDLENVLLNWKVIHRK